MSDKVEWDVVRDALYKEILETIPGSNTDQLQKLAYAFALVTRPDTK